MVILLSNFSKVIARKLYMILDTSISPYNIMFIRDEPWGYICN